MPKDGLHFVTASGGAVPNLGEHKVHFRTEDGFESITTFQVTDACNPLAPAAKNSDDDSAASSDPEERSAMMFSTYRDWINPKLKETAGKFLKWANEAITPDPLAKYHSEKGTTSMRVVDPYNDPGIWALVDEGANSNTHSEKWMENARAKWAKKGFRRMLKSSTATKFTGVGSKARSGKWTIPIALKFEESELIIPGSLWSHELPDSTHPLLLSQSMRAKLGFKKDVREGTITSGDYED